MEHEHSSAFSLCSHGTKRHWGTNQRTKRNILRWFIVLLLLISTVVLVATLLVDTFESQNKRTDNIHKNDSNSGISNNTNSSNDGNQAMTASPTEREEWLRTVLDPVLPSDFVSPSLLQVDTNETPLPPQTRAFHWLLDTTTSSTNIEEYAEEQMIVERYILAVFGFAVSSRSSNNSKKDWKTQVPFLTTGHACDWSTTFHSNSLNGPEGVTCDSSGRVTKLVFSK